MRILCNILVVLFVTTTAVGQQINPVPDYIFRNSMSVGRNAPTDTSAYFSIGPRFGATRGFMPPMVVDTAAVTGTKRNGLLIYSIQRNSFLYWDSTGSRWSRIAANLDTLQLATRAWRQKGDDSLAARINTRTDTLLIATRAWRQKGDDSLAARIATAGDTNTLSTRAWRQKGIDSVASVRIGGSGVTGYIPKFTAARTLDSSQLSQLGGNIGLNTPTPLARLHITGTGGEGLPIFRIDATASDAFNWATNTLYPNLTANENAIHFIGKASSNNNSGYFGYRHVSDGSSSNLITLGMYAADNLLNIQANGNTGVGTLTPDAKLHVTPTSGADGIIIENPQVTPSSIRQSAIYATGNGQTTSGANNSEFFLTVAGPGSTGFTDGPVMQMTGNNFSRFSNNRGVVFFTAGSITTPVGGDGALAFQSPSNYIDFLTGSSPSSKMRIVNNGRVLINSTTDAGDHQLQVTGNIRATGNIDFGSNQNITSAGRAAMQMGTSGTLRLYSSGSTTGIQFYPNNAVQMSIEDGGEVWMGYTTDQGAFRLQVNGAALADGGYRSGAPNGGTAATWKLGTVATVSPTSPNRTIEVEINGTTYYLHAKTTND